MKDYKLSLSNLGFFIQQVTKLLTDNQSKHYRGNICEYRERRSLSQNALQHVIYQDISKYLIANGRAEWSADVVKLSLKNKFLGYRTVSITDVITGEIADREMIRETKSLDTGEAYHYTTQIIEWSESIGCNIKIPANCAYRDLMERQNE